MKRKYLTLVASIVIMLCIGGVYAWSTFVKPLIDNYNLTNAQTQIVFGFTIAVFSIVMILAGKIEKKYGPKICTLIGMVLFVAGYLIASISKGNIFLIIAGIGVLSGAGIGFCYISALISPVKCFPNKKGLITGIAAAGFGGGAIILSNIVELLLVKKIDVLEIFSYIGLVYGMIILISLFFLSSPKIEENSENVSEKNIMILFKDRILLGLFFGMFAGTFAGLLVIGNLKPIGMSSGVSETMATLGISLFALGNMIGRVLWGYVSDKLKDKTAIILSLIFLTVSTLALTIVTWHGVLFLIISLAIGLCFGANFVLYAKAVSHTYGAHNLGLIYPYIFLAYGLAGLTGPTTGGELFDITQTYTLSIIVSAVICVVGIIIYRYLAKGAAEISVSNIKPE